MVNITVDVEPYGKAEDWLMNNMGSLKSNNGMSKIACQLGMFFGSDKNRYIMSFDNDSDAHNAVGFLKSNLDRVCGKN